MLVYQRVLVPPNHEKPWWHVLDLSGSIHARTGSRRRSPCTTRPISFRHPVASHKKTVNRKGQARICDVAEKHWSCDELCEGCPKQEEIRRAKDFDRL